MEHYHPVPRLYIAYDRTAYFGKENHDFRMTFDSHIRSRRTDLLLEKGDSGSELYDTDYHLLETKVGGAYPLWLVKKYYQTMKSIQVSFSKYGNIYKKELTGGIEYDGAIIKVLGLSESRPSITGKSNQL